MKKIFFYLFLYKKIFFFFFYFSFSFIFLLFLFFFFFYFSFIFIFLLFFFFFLFSTCHSLVGVITKTEWRVAKSKIVFDAVQRSPAVSAGATANGGPNLVCEGIVEDL